MNDMPTHGDNFVRIDRVEDYDMRRESSRPRATKGE